MHFNNSGLVLTGDIYKINHLPPDGSPSGPSLQSGASLEAVSKVLCGTLWKPL
jgi:hypothetical protein